MRLPSTPVSDVGMEEFPTSSMQLEGEATSVGDEDARVEQHYFRL